MSRKAAEASVEDIGLYKSGIVIDLTCPALRERPELVAQWHEAGVTVVAPTLATDHDPGETLRTLGRWHRLIRKDGRLKHIGTVADIYAAKESGRLGILFAFQNTTPVGTDLDLLHAYNALGLRLLQLTYNRQNYVGSGCEEPEDAGLSRFGRALVETCNGLGVVVDCSHAGKRTTLDAVDASRAPVVVSHANAYGVHPSGRNVDDEVVKAIAQSGGVVGLNGFPAFVAASPHPAAADLARHAAYIAELVGARHVALGLDYFHYMDGYASVEEARAFYDKAVVEGIWHPDQYPPPPWRYPAGLETVAGLPNFVGELLKIGFNEDEVRGVLGENALRVFNEVWSVGKFSSEEMATSV